MTAGNQVPENRFVLSLNRPPLCAGSVIFVILLPVQGAEIQDRLRHGRPVQEDRMADDLGDVGTQRRRQPVAEPPGQLLLRDGLVQPDVHELLLPEPAVEVLHPLRRELEAVDGLLGRGFGVAGAPGDLRQVLVRLAAARELAETPPHRPRHVRIAGRVVVLGEDPLDEGVDDGPAAGIVGHGDFDPGLLQHPDAAAVNPGVGIPESHHDPVDPGEGEGGRAGRRLPVVAAGLQRHVGRHRDIREGVPEEGGGSVAALPRGRVGFHEGRQLFVVIVVVIVALATHRPLHDAPRRGDPAVDVPRCLQQGEDLGVGVPRPGVEAGAEDIAGVLLHQETSDGGVGKGVAVTDVGVFQGPRQEPPIVVRYGGGRVGGNSGNLAVDVVVGGGRREEPRGRPSRSPREQPGRLRRISLSDTPGDADGTMPGPQDQGLCAPTPRK